ncbi:retinal homeobox protein Rax [Lingula anatina]|uniref:Retinal homeobox protein Rax n=1 Tax=Lingula anatina TaxID=7574 RepID=A0A1S3IWB7_LINAN|nr:retinal homeobox protein Rax [Lingula anatina]|eukprot:XP_013401844.1 retinal homeobox protein Rax [Lingula anatina]
MADHMPADDVLTGIQLRKRRKRSIITPCELQKLNQLYKRDHWPSRGSKALLAKEIGKNTEFVTTWFQNRRAKARREKELVIAAPKPFNKVSSTKINLTMASENIGPLNAEEEKTSPVEEQPVNKETLTETKDTDLGYFSGNLRNEFDTVQQANIPPSLFRDIVLMMALAEGGIVKPTDVDFGRAVNNHLYGVRLGNGSRLLYSKRAGFFFKESPNF